MLLLTYHTNLAVVTKLKQYQKHLRFCTIHKTNTSKQILISTSMLVRMVWLQGQKAVLSRADDRREPLVECQHAEGALPPAEATALQLAAPQRTGGEAFLACAG